MNIDNLNKLIAHLEAQPPERFNMRFLFSGGEATWLVPNLHECGTAACIAGHCALLQGFKVGNEYGANFAGPWLGLYMEQYDELFCPDNGESNYFDHPEKYPLSRAIATLKRLRDTYLSTGQVVVDWGPEPGEEPKTPWTAPQIKEVIAPALPAELTSLLRTNVEA